ncbi:hypothetical protein OH146_07295 [Salinibacterium sp. SYSU T00001]|uniref:hypothetical protein n=1 Tax=Homoserinimonas sedimenticola TaxID=2986805 RepID=UPI00223599D5|nr:hypothetical protein [Salinibacterium sedimenticola]MCW4385577.1 hypothetical protein [Salinibacterium sedimenticola]
MTTRPAVRLLWMAGFLIGTTTHVIDLAVGGLGVYAGFPAAVQVFWISLTLLDPLMVLLLALGRRAAIPLGVAIMVADVAVNVSVAIAYELPFEPPYPVLLQCAFGLFVVFTAPSLWKRFGLRTRTVSP